MARARTAAAQNSGETGGNTPPVGRRFQPGQSGNPSGRPKGLARRARELSGGDDGETVLLFYASVYADPKEKTADRMRAAEFLLERGWGKAPVFAPIEDGDPLELGEHRAEEIALDFDASIDELAKRRETARTDAKRRAGPSTTKRKPKPKP